VENVITSYNMQCIMLTPGIETFQLSILVFTHNSISLKVKHYYPYHTSYILIGCHCTNIPAICIQYAILCFCLMCTQGVAFGYVGIKPFIPARMTVS